MTLQLPSTEEFKKALDAMPKEELNPILELLASEIDATDTRESSEINEFQMISSQDDL